MQNSVASTNFNRKLENKNRHSISFFVYIMLFVYTVVFYYYKAYIETMLKGSYIRLLPVICMFLILCAILLLYMSKTGKIFNKQIFLFFVFVLSGLVSYFVTFSGLEKLLGLCVILFSLLIFQQFPIKSYERKSLYYILIIMVLVLLANGTTVDKMESEVNKFNPNSCGFLLAILFCVSVVRYSRMKGVLNLIMIIASLGLQLVYASRTSLIGCIIFFALFIISKAWKKSYSKKSAFWSIFTLSMFGLVVAYLYSEVLYPAIGHGKIFIFGKDLFTGRQTIWNFTFQSIKENFLFGVGSHLNEEQLAEGYYDLIVNAHNQPLGMLATFGFLPFIIFYVVFAYFVAVPYKMQHKDDYKLLSPVIFIITITIMSYFDIYFLSEYNWLPIIIAFSLICGYSIKNKDKNENNSLHADI